MSTPPLPRLARPALARGPVLLVLGLHALLLAGAWRVPLWQDRGPAAPAQTQTQRQTQAPLIVWLPGAQRPAAAARPPDTAPITPTRRANAVLAATRREPQALTLPASPGAPGLAAGAPSLPAAPGAASATAHAPAPPASTAAPRLNLALPRGASAPWRTRHPALDDPRSNSPPLTVEGRIAKALGGVDGIEEFRLEDGSVRFKRGDRCVIARPNRAGALDPFNASAQIRPRLLDSC